jgi:hypothetical protein
LKYFLLNEEKVFFSAATSTMNADDLKYILAEEGRYTNDEENEAIMDEGIAAIDVDEMNGETSESENEPACRTENEKPSSISSDPHFSDYETPDDIKTRGGENYHINKLRTKPHSPKAERRQKRERRVNDIRQKESRCHKKQIHDL